MSAGSMFRLEGKRIAYPLTFPMICSRSIHSIPLYSWTSWSLLLSPFVNNSWVVFLECQQICLNDELLRCSPAWLVEEQNDLRCMWFYDSMNDRYWASRAVPYQLLPCLHITVQQSWLTFYKPLYLQQRKGRSQGSTRTVYLLYRKQVPLILYRRISTSFASLLEPGKLTTEPQL